MKTKKELVTDAWIELFWKYWPRRTSIDQIVKKANVAKGTFYLYFKNKEDLYEYIIHNTFLYWEEVVAKLVNNIDNIKDRIINKMMLSLKFFEKDDIMRNILFWNEDYNLWKINKKYIEKLHIELLKPIFKNSKELDYDLILKIMWFYVNVINIRWQFKNEKEYEDFVLNFAWIIVNWIFSDYKEDVKNYKSI